MNYLSICSGIEAASVAWEPLGWKPVGFSEIEKFPSAVLAHHWPDVPNLGDMTKHHEWPTTLQPDLIVGGTPCQAFSVAGLRQGLADPRGNLTLTFLSILEQYRPRWVVWENVPGVLSDKTGAFGAFLGGLGELGYGFAYRVLDAQFFGVPQRRRRVFVVGCLGDWQRAAAVLFEPHSLQGHSPPRREAGKRTATGFETGADGSGEPIFLDRAAFNQGENAQFDPVIRSMSADQSHANGGGQVAIAIHDMATRHQGTNGSGADVGKGHGLGIAGPEDPMFTLTKGDKHAVMFERRFVRTTGGQPQDELSHCLRADNNTGDGAPCVAIAGAIGFIPKAPPNSRSMGEVFEQSPTITTHQLGQGVVTNHIVRRLTPTECERLQGFPDGHTLITFNGKPAADGPRYKALGNSMAVPVMRWIGERIKLINSLNQ